LWFYESVTPALHRHFPKLEVSGGRHRDCACYFAEYGSVLLAGRPPGPNRFSAEENLTRHPALKNLEKYLRGLLTYIP
jgi:hypothetical protein